MPLNVRRFCTSLFLVVFSFIFISAQNVPTSGDVMRARISRAKALIAVKNFNAATYELENIRRETNDPTVHGVLNVLLMNCYLEQGDYKRAQDFLATLQNDLKNEKQNSAANYYAAAGQVIKSARLQSERYKSLGLSVSDRNLPPEALSDLEGMRNTLEKVVEQSKAISKDARQTSSAFALLEEASNARSMLARDDFDARRWKDEVADAREMLANSKRTVFNATNEVPPQINQTMNVPANTVASNNFSALPTNTLPVPTGTQEEEKKPIETAPVFKSVSTTPTENPQKVTESTTAKLEKAETLSVKETPKQENPKKNDENITPDNQIIAENNNQIRQRERWVEEKTSQQGETVKNDEPLNVGSLLGYAVERRNPVYPPNARNLRQTGIVRVEVLIDEEGNVAEIKNTSGPSLLQNAAKDAVKSWKFKPFVRDGQPVKATGYLSFNFNL
jgi:TonB family protein